MSFKSNFEKFKCKNCDFSRHSENGLKTHVTKTHKEKTENVEETFPKQCSLCNLFFKNSKCFYGPRKCQPWPSDQRNLPTKDFFSDQKYL